MADNDDVPGGPERDGVTPEPTTTHPVVPAETAETTPAPILKSRWRARAWTCRAMLAVAAASLVIGGIVGGAIVAVAKHGHDDHGFHRMGPWGPGAGVPPGWQRLGPHK